MRLDVQDHDRDSAGLKYVYPVVSRRAGGVSLGINLNPNNACNWRCIYCQVPELVFGNAPKIDLEELERELDQFLRTLLETDYMQVRVPEGARRLRDIAISGNGEPTSAREFPEVVALAGRALERFDLRGKIELVLITNGSLIHHEHVQRGLKLLRELGGVVWFKLDSATSDGQSRINNAHVGIESVRRNLELCARACPTWIQTIVFALDGAPPSAGERRAYLDFLRELVRDEVPLRGVLLYGLARPSHQPELPRLSALPQAWLRVLGEEIRNLGLTVRIHP